MDRSGTAPAFQNHLFVDGRVEGVSDGLPDDLWDTLAWQHSIFGPNWNGFLVFWSK